MKTVKIYYVSSRIQSVSVTTAVAGQIQAQWQTFLVCTPDQQYSYQLLGLGGPPVAYVNLNHVESIEVS